MAHSDVIVIGGGLAGLVAARELRGRGYHCRLLEARDRLGGRTWTTDFAGTQVEFGGTYVTWQQPFVFSELTRYGIEMFPSPAGSPEAGFLWQTPGGVVHEPTEEFWSMWNTVLPRFFEPGRALLPRPYTPDVEDPALLAADALSVRDRMDQLGFSPEEQARAGGVVSALSAAPWDEVAFTSLLRRYAVNSWRWQFVLEVADYEIKGGTGRLIEALAQDAAPELELQTPVTAIDVRDHRVTVRTATGENHTAAAAVLAVPLNLLSSIDVTPGLPSGLQRLAAEGQPSRGLKVWVRLRGEVPAASLFGGAHLPFVMGWPEGRLPDGDTLMQFFSLESGRLDPFDRDAVAKILAPYYPDAEVVDSAGVDWGSDPWARGVWEMFRPGQFTRYFPDLDRTDGRLFTAGAFTSSGCAHGIDSAIESGLRVAGQVHGELTGRHGRLVTA